MKSTPLCRYAITSGLLVAAVLGVVSHSEQAAGQRRKKDQIPKVQRITVTSRDGVLVRCNYYPGGVIERPGKKKDEREYVKRPGKEVVPVILLHGWKGRRGEYDYLASDLQRRGHAVIVPDLRGHGDSTTVRLAGGDKKIDLDRMRPQALAAMILDVDAAKKFLLALNNDGELNIEMLCVVGAELGGIVAVNWAVRDWSWPQLPAFKQGQDVKALVLLSPEETFKGYSLNRALQHPIVRSRLSIMIVAAQEDRSRYSDAKAIHKRLQRYRKDSSDASEKDLFLLEPSGTFHGTQLVDRRWQRQIPVARNIALFIERRLLDRSELFRWSERKNPLSNSD